MAQSQGHGGQTRPSEGKEPPMKGYGTGIDRLQAQGLSSLDLVVFRVSRPGDVRKTRRKA